MNNTCEYNRYPHTDINVQNLDWLIDKINELEHTVDVFTTLNKLTWAGDWNIGEAYSQWSLVSDLEGNGYVSIVPVPRNVQITNTDYWQPVAKYDSLYQAFEERITTLETFNDVEIPKIEAKIQNNSDNIDLNSTSITEINEKIETINSQLTNVSLGNRLYPVGSIYLTLNNDNPSVYFGGTWERIKDRFLLARGDIYSNTYATGGEAEHKLTIEEMPSHSHKIGSLSKSDGNWLGFRTGSQDSISSLYDSYSTGGDKAHNNMPPFIVVNVWKRTA